MPESHPFHVLLLNFRSRQTKIDFRTKNKLQLHVPQSLKPLIKNGSKIPAVTSVWICYSMPPEKRTLKYPYLQGGLRVEGVVQTQLHCSPTLDRRKLDFPDCCTAPQRWTAGSWIFPAVSR